MKRDLQSCTVNCVFFFCGLFFDFVLSPVFKYKALVGVLSSSIWVLYQGRSFLATTERKNITNLSCFKCAHYKVFVFFMFLFHGVCKPINVPETSKDWTHKYHRRHLCSLPVFVLNIPLFTLLTFSYRHFFPLFVCFEILWQLATTHATGTQIVRAKMTSLDAIFCRGNKSSSHSLARFCRRKHKKSTARTSRSWKYLSKSSTTT